MIYLKRFENKEKAVGHEETTPLVETIKNVNKVLFAKNRGKHVKIKDDGDDFIMVSGDFILSLPQNTVPYGLNANSVTYSSLSGSKAIGYSYEVIKFSEPSGINSEGEPIYFEAIKILDDADREFTEGDTVVIYAEASGAFGKFDYYTDYNVLGLDNVSVESLDPKIYTRNTNNDGEDGCRTWPFEIVKITGTMPSNDSTISITHK